LASWSWSWWIHEAGVSAGEVGGAARIVLGLLYPRRLQKTYHAAGGGCRNRACQVRSWSFEEAGLDLGTGGRLDRLHIATCASMVGISMEPPVVSRDWSPVSSNKACGYCCRTSCRPSSPIAAEACSSAVFTHTWCSASRLPPEVRAGLTWLRPGRKRFLCQLPL
jgi:hypothetical protein